MLDATLGVNWYVNPYCKCVFNYIHSWTDSPFVFNPAGTSLANTTPTGVLTNTQTDFYGARCQIDF
jgi:phosphate-selective porin